MTPENFCYWLQGVFEVVNPEGLSKEQLDVVKEHLQLVFNKVTIKQVLVDSDKPNKNGDKFTTADLWIEYCKKHKTEQISRCTSIPTDKKLCDSKEHYFPFMFNNPDGTPVASC